MHQQVSKTFHLRETTGLDKLQREEEETYLLLGSSFFLPFNSKVGALDRLLLREANGYFTNYPPHPQSCGLAAGVTS